MTPRGVPLQGFAHEAVCSVIRSSGDFYEADILDAVRERRPSETTIVDVGAHIGNHSVYWLEFVRPRRLVALEPMPDSFRFLRANLRRYPQAMALPLACSDAPGPVALLRDEVNRGRSHISAQGDVPAWAVRLDALGIEALSLLKVDVEGWQSHVLAGAAKTLRCWRPALLIEDEEGFVGPALRGMGLQGYAVVAEFPGANFLWEWTA